MATIASVPGFASGVPLGAFQSLALLIVVSALPHRLRTLAYAQVLATSAMRARRMACARVYSTCAPGAGPPCSTGTPVPGYFVYTGTSVMASTWIKKENR